MVERGRIADKLAVLCKGYLGIIPPAFGPLSTRKKRAKMVERSVEEKEEVDVVTYMFDRYPKGIHLVTKFAYRVLSLATYRRLQPHRCSCAV